MATFSEDVVAPGRGGMGFGGGEGLGGGLLLGLLLGRGGLFGNDNRYGNDGRCVNTDDLNAQALGDIKAAIPYNEAQVQLALAGLQASLSQQANQNTQYLSAGQNTIQLAQQSIAAGLARDIATVDTNVDRQSQAVQNAIVASERRVTDLITGNRIADLEQQLTVSQLRESEQRGINREIVNTNTITIGMNQQQAQQQQQMQALQWQLNQLCGGISQFARATNSTVQVGNTGATTGGAQTANPANVVA